MEKLGSSTSNDSSHAEAEYTHFVDRTVQAHYGNPAAEYVALKDGTAVTERPQTVLRLSGKDPIGMLNAILTNDVPKEDDLGVYALLLDPKGRVQSDLRVLKGGEDILVVTEPEGVEAARNILGRYAPFSRVKLEDLDSYGILGLYGPRASGLLGGLDLGEHETAKVDVGDVPVLATGVLRPVPGYDLIGPTRTLQGARDHLIEHGAFPVGLHAYETVRIETKTPRFGSDITPENFPAEAGILEQAVSFAKGCYPGQETIARMHYRGHPNRALHRLKIEGATPTPDTPIFQNGKQVGKITSVAPLPVDGETLALGYLHRNADPNGALHSEEATVSLA
ncbi:folate-binding protein YgfZ [soil metagenome]|jgi:folate-binding protein YgfZ